MDKHDPTAYEELNAVLREFVTSTQAVLGDNVIAAYLHGSFAVGDWDIYSDVDFLVALNHDVREADLPALQAMHARIYRLASPRPGRSILKARMFRATY